MSVINTIPLEQGATYGEARRLVDQARNSAGQLMTVAVIHDGDGEQLEAATAMTNKSMRAVAIMILERLRDDTGCDCPTCKTNKAAYQMVLKILDGTAVLVDMGRPYNSPLN